MIHVGEAVLSAVAALAAELSAYEAGALARRIGEGQTLTQALAVADRARQRVLKPLLENAGIGPANRATSVLVLTAVEGARAHDSTTEPVWTVPPWGRSAVNGTLTTDLAGLVDGAFHSVTCSTFNLAPSSALWKALQRAARRPGVSVRLYMDANVADGSVVPETNQVTTALAARRLDRATLLRPAPDEDGSRPRNHAKVLIVDRQILVVTSANLSYSAEVRNIELGLRMNDPFLARSVEGDLRKLEEAGVYEVVERG